MLKNKEVRRYILSAVIITAIVGVAAYIFKLPAFIAVVIEGVLLFLLWFVDMQGRYRHMEKMAQEIDLILHGRAAGMLSEYEEGDISILRNEIAKMTVMLRQQAEQLGDEKHKLADALADISHQIRTPLTSINIIQNIQRQLLPIIMNMHRSFWMRWMLRQFMSMPPHVLQMDLNSVSGQRSVSAHRSSMRGDLWVFWL